MVLNKEAYRHEPDNLIYDSSHGLDASNAVVKLEEGKTGSLKRGQILDFTTNAFQIHTAEGKASAIVAEDTEYAADDTEITVPIYISGTFRKSACISDVELSAADVEELRYRGIYLK